MDDFVPGAGWISDESSLYGDHESEACLEEDCAHDPKPCTPVDEGKRAATDVSGVTLECRALVESVVPSAEPRSQAERNQDRSSTLEKEAAQSHVTKSYMQTKISEPSRWSPSKHPSETVQDFLLRVPVSDPGSARAGPWLWVYKPDTGAEGEVHEQAIGELIGRSEHILGQHRQERAKVEGQESRQPAKTSKKTQLGLLRDRLVEDLLQVATETGMTTGKWMLFPDATELSRYWQLVVEATSAGRLGPTAKVGTIADVMADQTLICVYTPDFSDIADVTRVLCSLVELGLCKPRGKPIYYKCDMYTYLDIGSSNEYGLRASLYSSKEILDLKTTGKSSNTVIKWIQKRGQTIETKDDFLF